MNCTGFLNPVIKLCLYVDWISKFEFHTPDSKLRRITYTPFCRGKIESTPKVGEQEEINEMREEAPFLFYHSLPSYSITIKKKRIIISK